MNATCRPGGGPTRDGTDAPRNDSEIQRAWYNGWKKLHGLKWQTIDLPNRMNFKVDGPFSVRENDLNALHDSEILLNYLCNYIRSNNNNNSAINNNSSTFITTTTTYNTTSS
jgi:hypothetical protein